MDWEKWPVVRYLGPFWAVGIGSAVAGKALTILSGLAFAIGASFAAFQARRGCPDPLRDVLFIAALILIACFPLLVPNDLAYRIGRFLFVPHALC